MSDPASPQSPANDSSSPQFRQGRFAAPPGSTRILLVRHGESAAADLSRPFDLVDGQGDPPLHPEGRLQARAACERLAKEPIDAIYVTTLRRTVETAALLVAMTGIEPVVEADLREIHLGDWEGGLFRKHVAEAHPLAVASREQERWDIIPGAESPEAFRSRVRAGIERVAAAHPDQLVAVFTHGGVIGEVLAIATGSRPFAFGGADNASISHLVVTPQKWIVRSYNDTSHLSSGFSTAAAPLT